MRSFSSAVNRRRVGLATTSGAGGTIPTGWGEAAAPGDSSTLAFLLSMHDGVRLLHPLLYEERQRVPLILAQRASPDAVMSTAWHNMWRLREVPNSLFLWSSGTFFAISASSLHLS